MQVNGSATNLAYKAPVEVDGQDRTQSRLQSQTEQTSTTSRPSRDTVDISSEAQALRTQEMTNEATMVVQEPARVEARQAVANVGRDQQSTPPPPVPPEQESLAATEQTTETTNTTPQQTTEQAAPTTPSAQTADTAPQNQSAQQSTIVNQDVAPQNETTPQKPATEGPMAAVGGLSAGKGSIDLNV